MRGLTLDTGALVALERGDERLTALLDGILAMPDAIIHIPAGVLAQAFRDGARQVKLRRLLKRPQARVVVLDERIACIAGMLLGVRGGHDIVDASVVVCARRYRQPVVTGDPDDLRRLAPELSLRTV
jgi:hypothetical protein